MGLQLQATPLKKQKINVFNNVLFGVKKYQKTRGLRFKRRGYFKFHTKYNLFRIFLKIHRFGATTYKIYTLLFCNKKLWFGKSAYLKHNEIQNEKR